MEPLRNKIEMKFWLTVGLWERRIRSVRCFFTGHSVWWSSNSYYDPTLCRHCWFEEPNEDHTIPAYLNRVYVWVCEHGGERWESLDQWLWDHIPGKYFPSWWEY